MIETVKTLALIFLSICLSVGGQFALKHGVMTSSGRVALDTVDHTVAQVMLFFQSPFIWLGLGLYACGAVSWMMILSRADISYAYPMLALSYVFATALAVSFLNESVGPFRWAGLIMITLGVVFITNEPYFTQLFQRLTTQ